MADHSKPTLASQYVDFVDEMKGRLEDISRGFDPAHTTPSNVPENAIRWSSGQRKWQRWTGTSWVDLASSYAISITGSAAKLATKRNIALSGGATGSADFDGSENITINVSEIDPEKLSSAVPIDKGGTGATSIRQARTNLELGTSATLNVGTNEGTVAAGDDPRIVNAVQGQKALGSTNLNTLGSASHEGIYFQPATAEATTARGYPINIAGTLYVTRSAYGCQQMYVTFSGGRMFVRGLSGGWNGSNGPWSEWFEVGGAVAWAAITGKPATFPPSSHTHPWNQITGAPATALRWPVWGEVTGKPSGFMPPTTAGAVGTYAFVTPRTWGPALYTWGGTTAGSNLTISGVEVFMRPGGSAAEAIRVVSNPAANSGTALSGTWRIMGSRAEKADQNSDARRAATLAVRIS